MVGLMAAAAAAAAESDEAIKTRIMFELCVSASGFFLKIRARAP